jgi:hypothetical protein
MCSRREGGRRRRHRTLDCLPLSGGVVGGSPGAPRAVRVSAVGLGVGQDSAVLGTYEMSVVHLDPECRIVVMPARDVQLENFRRLLEQTPNVCVVRN